ncbi:Gem-associated protein 8, partial [Galemys pyrenaicus]
VVADALSLSEFPQPVLMLHEHELSGRIQQPEADCGVGSPLPMSLHHQGATAPARVRCACRSRSSSAASSDAPGLWSSHPVYTRYWQHYHQAMAWMRCHQNAYRKAVESYFASLWHYHSEAHPRSSHASQGGSQLICDHQLAPPDAYDSHPRAREHQALCAEEEAESESDGVECDVSNMEITEELRQYFAETERHREERLACLGSRSSNRVRFSQPCLCSSVICTSPHGRQQLLDEARLNDYVYADHDLYHNRHRSAEPPSERPGERRQAEMKRLYGDSAAKIQAMEAAVQLSFDKHCDRKRPKYWPVIPLKF